MLIHRLMKRHKLMHPDLETPTPAPAPEVTTSEPETPETPAAVTVKVTTETLPPNTTPSDLEQQIAAVEETAAIADAHADIAIDAAVENITAIEEVKTWQSQMEAQQAETAAALTSLTMLVSSLAETTGQFLQAMATEPSPAPEIPNSPLNADADAPEKLTAAETPTAPEAAPEAPADRAKEKVSRKAERRWT
jgi:aminoglycoside phosphotransferase (APT) family kinase protein